MDLKTPRVKTRTKCLENPSGGKSKKALLLLLCFLYQCLRQCLYVIHPTVVIFGPHTPLWAQCLLHFTIPPLVHQLFSVVERTSYYTRLSLKHARRQFFYGVQLCYALLPRVRSWCSFAEALALLLGSMVFRVGNYGL